MKRPMYYVLDADNRPVPADLMQWAECFESPHRTVDKTQVGLAQISTVFLGLDQRFMGDGPPLLFETMIFGGPLDGQMWRYSSWEDAETGHRATVRRAKSAARSQPGVQFTGTR